MRASPRRALTILALAASAHATHAQEVVVSVRGVAFDSLRGRPLAGAFVTLDGAANVASDSAGRFRFDGVRPGTHTLAVQHAALDSAGLTGIASQVAVVDGTEDVRIATPSFATLWRSFCGPAKPPADSGFVFGTVADARTGARLAGASVDLGWMQLRASDKRHQLAITQVPWRGVTRTNAGGAYAICGTPLGVALHIRALTDSTTSDDIDLMPEELRVRRRDLLLGPLAADTASRGRGTVVGTVTNPAGAPLPDAHVVMTNGPEVRSDSAGRFVVRDVPVGTRQIEVLAVGMSPFVTTVDVVAGDTTALAASLRRITTLDVVRVTASRRVRMLVAELDERRRVGHGYIRDSAFVQPHGTMSAVFSEFPGAQVEHARGTSADRFVVTMRSMMGGGRCTPPVWVDGTRSDYERLSDMRPDEIAIVEVYPRAFDVPVRFASGNMLCGTVAVWTKWAFR